MGTITDPSTDPYEFIEAHMPTEQDYKSIFGVGDLIALNTIIDMMYNGHADDAQKAGNFIKACVAYTIFDREP